MWRRQRRVVCVSGHAGMSTGAGWIPQHMSLLSGRSQISTWFTRWDQGELEELNVANHMEGQLYLALGKEIVK